MQLGNEQKINFARQIRNDIVNLECVVQSFNEESRGVSSTVRLVLKIPLELIHIYYFCTKAQTNIHHLRILSKADRYNWSWNKVQNSLVDI